MFSHLSGKLVKANLLSCPSEISKTSLSLFCCVIPYIWGQEWLRTSEAMAAQLTHSSLSPTSRSNSTPA